MIPLSKLLPPLSPADAEAFRALAADHKQHADLVRSFSNEARVARKKALRAEMKTAPSKRLLTLGAELETLDESFQEARRGAKHQLRALCGRYVELFPRLITACEHRADELLKQVAREYAKHFAAFGAEPVGQSPLAEALQAWKAQLGERRRRIESYGVGIIGQPDAPASILPYELSSNTETNPLL